MSVSATKPAPIVGADLCELGTHRLERAEAAYKANRTQANYDRLTRLIARRTKDGR
jgi:hypothetical protein